ncbi:WecB/TagA/CpsF family glycosyltransferase [Halomonas sp. H33-56]|uniref:WecB/TagA/CpsF family glycosyltransferase n=1 Tax=Halomonas sp. H33-56 TaxID=2950873 RepID=UPI0032E00B72
MKIYPRENRKIAHVTGIPIDELSWNDAISIISQWAEKNESKYVCICNAHSIVTAKRDLEFNTVIDEADMATPDGAPVAWMMSRGNKKRQERINGPDLMIKYFDQANKSGQSVFLYGGMPATLCLLEQKIREKFPFLKIAGTHSPPFRKLSNHEKQEIVRKINESGANTVWVGLGCPKQEKWMYEHRGEISAVMIGVGAAFDYHAGVIKRAPMWMQNNGLEWLHRLISEPRRLWRRYFFTNTLFVMYALKEIFSSIVLGWKKK